MSLLDELFILLVFYLFSVKTRKEAKQIAIADSLSVTKARIEELKGVVEDHRARRDEYAAIISEQSNGNLLPFTRWQCKRILLIHHNDICNPKKKNGKKLHLL